MRQEPVGGTFGYGFLQGVDIYLRYLCLRIRLYNVSLLLLVCQLPSFHLAPCCYVSSKYWTFLLRAHGHWDWRTSDCFLFGHDLSHQTLSHTFHLRGFVCFWLSTGGWFTEHSHTFNCTDWCQVGIFIFYCTNLFLGHKRGRVLGFIRCNCSRWNHYLAVLCWKRYCSLSWGGNFIGKSSPWSGCLRSLIDHCNCVWVHVRLIFGLGKFWTFPKFYNFPRAN